MIADGDFFAILPGTMFRVNPIPQRTLRTSSFWRSAPAFPAQGEIELVGFHLDNRGAGNFHQLADLVELTGGQQRVTPLYGARGAHGVDIRLWNERLENQLVVIVGAMLLAP
jgi:hypothetical protein